MTLAATRATLALVGIVLSIGLAACGASASGSSSGCDSNYTGACLDPNASDYDCAGGSGNGPQYTGTVTVVGDDHFGLDRDGNGMGCE
jgi:hypothetical protein